MISYLKKHLSLKILIVLAVILLISFAGLGGAVISKQGTLLTQMRERVYDKLRQTGEKAETQFGALQQSVSMKMAEMGQETATRLSAVTTETLSAEEEKIEAGMEKLLVSNAEAVAAVLSKVGQESIMAKTYDQLVEFSRAVAQTEEIVFAFFLDEQGTVLPGYVNIVDDLVISYLEQAGSEDEEDIQKKAADVYEAAKKDSSVFIYERDIEYYNLPIGKIVVCVNKATVATEIKALAARFDELKRANEQAIKNIIGKESAAVINSIKNDLARVVGENTAAIDQTGEILLTSAQQVKDGTRSAVILIGTICCVGVIVAVAVMLRLMVTTPIHQITEGLRDTAEGEGDLTKRLSSDRTDEIGMLANWFDIFVAKLNSIIVDIGANSETVTSSSFEVLSASEQMYSDSESLKGKANNVAVASEQMNVSMNSVAAASEQASTNIGFVAEAAAEMRQALDGVVVECDRAQEVSNSASEQVESATAKVSQLGGAADEISNVSEVITEIADQTNLLALNATIEAARAGEAGKGFAVVAGEIKELANQTQQATQQIKARIEGIQASTNDTVEEVGLISKVIGEVNEIIATIARSMAEQSGRAAEVAQNIEQASLGISEVNENVAQSSQVSTGIAADIAEVSTVAGEMSRHSAYMRQSSEELSELASQLRKMISIFKVSANELQKGKTDGEIAGKGRDLFPWTTSLETGIEKVDRQHQNLVRLINELYRAMKRKAGNQESGRILDELATYTKEHFSFEEGLFDRYGYPAAESHKKAHHDLVKRVIEFSEEFRSGKAGLSMDLLNFLTKWLREHIMKTDMAYVPFFKEKGLK